MFYSPRGTGVASDVVPAGAGRVYPGYGDRWVPGRAIPVPTRPSQDPRISHILRSKDYPRPNEGNSGVI